MVTLDMFIGSVAAVFVFLLGPRMLLQLLLIILLVTTAEGNKNIVKAG